MAMTVWDRLEERAVAAVREGTELDTAARQLLATGGGDRRMVLATRLRLAARVARTPDALVLRLNGKRVQFPAGARVVVVTPSGLRAAGT